jgi:hypothetical protein
MCYGLVNHWLPKVSNCNHFVPFLRMFLFSIVGCIDHGMSVEQGRIYKWDMNTDEKICMSANEPRVCVYNESYFVVNRHC